MGYIPCRLLVRAGLALMAGFASAAACAVAPAGSFGVSAVLAPGPEEEFWSTVHINAVVQPEPALIHIAPNGDIYTRPEDLARWALPLGAEPARELAGLMVVQVGARPGVQVHFDRGLQQLEFTVDPWVLPDATSPLQRHIAEPQPGRFAIFGNYQLHAQHAQQGHLAGSLELGASKGRMSFSSAWQKGEASDLVRLDTSIRLDFPARRERVLIGDTVSVAGIGGRSWRFAGAQWITDFDMAPELPTFALPSARGVATVPSTVDLYLNGALLDSREVAAGPYTLADIPVPTGTGTVMLRVRDALGREQRFEQRFLATPMLLPAGLTSHALQAGVLRGGYGTTDFEYAGAFAAASARRGLSHHITAETQLELSQSARAARIAIATRLGGSVVTQAGFAWGADTQGSSTAGDLTLDWQSRWFSFTTRGRIAGRDFVDVGTPRGESAALAHEWSAQISPRLPFAGSAGLTWTQRRLRAGGEVRVATAFASVSRVLGGSLMAEMSRISAPGTQLRGGLSYVRSIGGQRTTSLGGTRDRRGTELSWQYTRTAPRFGGWGWQIAGREGLSPEQMLRLEGRSRHGNADVQVRHQQHGTTVNAAWSGGWVWADATRALTAPLTQAIALVETPGIAGARVLHDGQDLGRTNRHGRLVATDLRAFEPNRLRLDVSDLPLDAWVESDQVSVRPFTRGVVAVRFETQALAALLTLRLPDGRFVPAGARVLLNDAVYPVGKEGRVSFPLPALRSRLQATWNEESCYAWVGQANAELPEVTCSRRP